MVLPPSLPVIVKSLSDCATFKKILSDDSVIVNSFPLFPIFKFVNVPAAGSLPPITVLSIVPSSISTLLIFTSPSPFGVNDISPFTPSSIVIEPLFVPLFVLSNKSPVPHVVNVTLLFSSPTLNVSALILTLPLPCGVNDIFPSAPFVIVIFPVSVFPVCNVKSLFPFDWNTPVAEPVPADTIPANNVFESGLYVSSESVLIPLFPLCPLTNVINTSFALVSLAVTATFVAFSIVPVVLPPKLPVTTKLPWIVVVESAPAPIDTSISPSWLPSSIINPEVNVPSCSATDIVNFPPSWPFVAILTWDLISENCTWSWFESSPKNCIIPFTSSAAPWLPLSLINCNLAPFASFVVFLIITKGSVLFADTKVAVSALILTLPVPSGVNDISPFAPSVIVIFPVVPFPVCNLKSYSPFDWNTPVSEPVPADTIPFINTVPSIEFVIVWSFSNIIPPLPLTSILVLAVIVVKAPVDCPVCPIGVLSITPLLISTFVINWLFKSKVTVLSPPNVIVLPLGVNVTLPFPKSIIPLKSLKNNFLKPSAAAPKSYARSEFGTKSLFKRAVIVKLSANAFPIFTEPCKSASPTTVKSLPTSIVLVHVNVVNEPGAFVLPPIVVPSIVPPSTSIFVTVNVDVLSS